MQTQKTLVEIMSQAGILNIDILSFLSVLHTVFWRLENSRTLLEKPVNMVCCRRWYSSMEKELSYLGGQMRKAGYLDEVKSYPVGVYAVRYPGQ